MATYTLDNNAIIDIEEKREPNYTTLFSLLSKNFEFIYITAVSASENPPINNFKQFKDKIYNIPELKSIPEERILAPMLIFNFGFLDWGLLGDGPGQPMVELKKNIASVLFPGLLPITEMNRSTRNKLSDVMTFWCHVYHKKDVFITRDSRFIKNKGRLKSIAKDFHGKDIDITTPQELCETMTKNLKE